jgi:hypothetical protein
MKVLFGHQEQSVSSSTDAVQWGIEDGEQFHRTRLPSDAGPSTHARSPCEMPCKPAGCLNVSCTHSVGKQDKFDDHG